MKIIKKGTKTPPDKITYIKRCNVCGCVSTYTMDDIDYTVIPDHYSFLICPQCEYRVSVPIIKRKYKGNDISELIEEENK